MTNELSYFGLPREQIQKLADKTVKQHALHLVSALRPADYDGVNLSALLEIFAGKLVEATAHETFAVPVSPHMPKRERPQKASDKSGAQYIRELVTYCGLTQSAILGIAYSQELEFLLEQLANAKDDALRLHHAYVDLKYPEMGCGSPEPKVGETFHEPTCAICGEHANEHLAIPHQFMPGGRAQGASRDASRCGNLCQHPVALKEAVACELAMGHEGNHKRGGWSWISQ